jgi:pyrimidine oxygenase
MDFTARHGDGAFLVGRDVEETIKLSLAMKRNAHATNRKVKTYTVFTLVMGETDDDARRLVEHFRSGADLEALDNVVRGSRSRTVRPDSSAAQFADIKLSAFFGCPPLAGSPATVASTIARLAHEGELDGVLFCFPDFIPALNNFGSRLMPRLRDDYGLR